MTESLRSVAQNCLGVSPPLSVLHDVFGYLFPPGRTMSLKRQLELIQGPAFDINICLVGVENFTATDFYRTQYAVQFTRDAYDGHNLGIRKINWRQISVQDAGSYCTIDSGNEAYDLTDDWNSGGPADALDVFVVRVMNGGYGVSAVDGPCDHDDKDEMTGSVVSLNCCGSCPSGVTCADDIGTTFAHEMGHYLGLKHDDSTSNLMGTSEGSVDPGTMSLTTTQGNTMRTHCYVSDIC